MRTLAARLQRLEEKANPPKPEPFGIHFHEFCKGNEDPRVTCPLCRAMSGEEYKEYQEWLKKDTGGPVKVIEVYLAKNPGG